MILGTTAVHRTKTRRKCTVNCTTLNTGGGGMYQRPSAVVEWHAVVVWQLCPGHYVPPHPGLGGTCAMLFPKPFNGWAYSVPGERCQIETPQASDTHFGL